MERMQKRLESFPTALVERSTSYFNKAFHARVFTLFASSESEIYTFSKEHTPHYDFCVCFMHDDEGQWYLDNNQIAKVRTWILEECKKGTQAIDGLYARWLRQWEQYLALVEKLRNTDLTLLSDEELYAQFESFFQLYVRVGSVAYITDSFMSTGSEDWLESLLSEELKKLSVEDTIPMLRALTSPIHLSFALDAEHKLLQIVAGLEKTPFESLDESIKERFEEMERKFHWIQNNYYNVHYISAEEFYGQAMALLEEQNVERQLADKEAELKEFKKGRAELLTQLGFSPFIKNLLHVANLFAKWKDDRKSGVYMGMYHFQEFLLELARRKDVSVDDLYCLVFDEIKEFMDGKDFSEEIEKRKQRCFFAVTPEGYFIAAGADAKPFFKYLEVRETNVTELRGVVASPGYAQGRVRIIKKTTDMAAFKQGEILVTNQTTPEFVPVMKKAAAIITEQGGVTSHAAVVSRELKKPCVIGTNIATQALQTGERVEVDANNGIVRKLR